MPTPTKRTWPEQPKPKLVKTVPNLKYTMTETKEGWTIIIGDGHPFPATDIEVNMWKEILRLQEILDLATQGETNAHTRSNLRDLADYHSVSDRVRNKQT
jgi:hypothetical protein